MSDSIETLKRQLKQAQSDLRDAQSENVDTDLIENLKDEVRSLDRRIKTFKPVSHKAPQFEVQDEDGIVRAIVSK